MNGLLVSLLLIAALALLPASIVGCAALGAAAAVWWQLRHPRKKALPQSDARPVRRRPVLRVVK